MKQTSVTQPQRQPKPLFRWSLKHLFTRLANLFVRSFIRLAEGVKKNDWRMTEILVAIWKTKERGFK